MAPETARENEGFSQDRSGGGADPRIESVEDLGPEAVPDEVAPDVGVAPLEPEVAFSWQASEYVHHHKSMLWYGGLMAVLIVVIGLAAILHFWLEIGLFVMMGAAVVVYANKPPRVMTYELSNDGIMIDGVLHPFGKFRSFGVLADEEWHSIDLEPAQRLRPRMVLLFDSTNYDQIVNHLERHLPREDRPLDIIEKVTRYVRF